MFEDQYALRWPNPKIEATVPRRAFSLKLHSLHAYNVLLTQELKQGNLECRSEFVNWELKTNQNGDNFESKMVLFD